MTPESRLKLKDLIINSEGFKQFPYVDTTGNLTIAYGRNLKTRGISQTEGLALIDGDIDYQQDKLSMHLKFFHTLNDARQAVLIDMAYNLGTQGLLGFTDMLLALESSDYASAASAMLDSKWAEQVGQRAITLATIMRTGEF